MPTVVEDLTDGMVSRITRSAGVLTRTLTRTFFFKDLPGVGINRFLSAWNLLGLTLQGDAGPVTIPRVGDSIIIAGRRLFAGDFELNPWADADAELKVAYNENVIGGFENTVIETGTTYELGETDFDGVNQLKPFNQREPMYLLYNPAAKGATVDSDEFRRPVRAPMLVGKSYRRFTKTLSKDPGPLSERFCSPPKTNKRPWKGYPTETALCLSIVGRNAGQGWSTTFDLAIDKINRFRYVERARDKETDRPVQLTKAQVAGRNGIDEFAVQPSDDFNALPI